MFEFEVGDAALRSQDAERFDLSGFGKFRDRIESASLVQWEEHCTECAMPMCYQTCDLFVPRRDGHCRRFELGMQKVNVTNDPLDTIIRVRFKRWAQLIGDVLPNNLPIEEFRAKEKKALRTANFAAALPGASVNFMGRRGLPTRMARRLKARILADASAPCGDLKPSVFVAEILNPNPVVVSLSFVVRNLDGPRQAVPYQQRIDLEPGFNLVEIDYELIENQVDASRRMHIILTPNIEEAADEGLELLFGLMSFVRLHGAKTNRTKPKAVKIVVWDLDNTLWKGTLIEDGADGLQLNEIAAATVKKLDERGIVNSIASKNDHESAMQCLQNFGLDEYFVYPKISWMPKSQAIREIREDFNVGEDTIAFVDDQPFERAEVAESLSAVRVYPETEISMLLTLPEFDVPKTADAAARRGFYRNQEHRDGARESFGDEYIEFLRSCDLQLEIFTPGVDSFDRVHELIQRTNQMNFSGTRYSRDELEELLVSPRFAHFCLRASDRFGEYGMVGFAMLEKESNTVQELTFSCRVQSKQVEHAFLIWLTQRTHSRGQKALHVRFNKTEKNAPVGRVFEDLSFELNSDRTGDTVYSIALDGALDQDLIAINADAVQFN